MKAFFLVIFSLCIFHSMIYAQTEPADSVAICDLISTYAEARKSQDSKMIRSLFTSDADQLVSSGEWRRGEQVLVVGMLRSSKNNPGDRSLEVEQVRLLTPNVAIADARYTIKGTDGRADRKMWSTFIAVKQEKGWRLSAIRNMLPAKRN